MAILASEVFDKLLTPEERAEADRRGKELKDEYESMLTRRAMPDNSQTRQSHDQS